MLGLYSVDAVQLLQHYWRHATHRPVGVIEVEQPTDFVPKVVSGNDVQHLAAAIEQARDASLTRQACGDSQLRSVTVAHDGRQSHQVVEIEGAVVRGSLDDQVE